MFCKNCGAEVAIYAATCPKCGTPVVNENGPSQTAAALTKAPNSISGLSAVCWDVLCLLWALSFQSLVLYYAPRDTKLYGVIRMPILDQVS